MAILPGFCAGNLLHASPHYNQGFLTVFSADGDEVVDRLPDGLTDESVDVWTERSFPRYCVVRNFHTGIVIGIFTMNLADGRTDGTDDGYTALQTVFLVTSRVGWQTDESCN